MARKTYTREFKLRALRLVTDRRLSVAEAARRLGIHENLLRAGKKVARDHGTAAFPGPGGPGPANDDKLRRLRAENARLRAERDLLKKAAAYFASPPS